MKLLKYISFITILSSTLLFGGSTALALAGNSSRASVEASHFAIAGTTQAQQQACQGLQQLDSTDNCTSNQNTIGNLTALIIRVLSIVVGVVSVIVIIFAGFRFITSGGDSNAVSSARTTLIYAIVGLAIAVLAQFIASAVLKSANTARTSANGKTGYIIIQTQKDAEG